MTVELHIAPHSATLLVRIWLWLSQIWGREAYIEAAESIFCLGPDDTLNGHRFQNIVCAQSLNRRQRRVLLRSIRAGLSLEQVKAWAQARRKSARFQIALSRYRGLAFLRFSHFSGDRLSLGAVCRAPLTPD